MKTLRNLFLVSTILKSNICLFFAAYGEFYGLDNYTKTAVPFFVSACASGVIYWILAAYHYETLDRFGVGVK